ncbi:MAG: M13 family metallopeptidase [Nannocystaceae bacterium]|nr:M13 family metallopeptidase [Nannocystaceae bacterium]
MSRVVVSTIGAPLAVAIACNPGPTSTPPEGGDPLLESSELSAQVHAVMDEKVDPCVDFFQFACGQWLDETEIPGHESRYGRFNALREHNEAALHALLDSAVAEASPDPETAQLAAFYGACMDEPAIEVLGAKPLASLLASVDEVSDPASLMRVVGQLHREGVPVLFDFGVGADYDQPDINIVHLSQGGLGLPDRDYYLRPGPEADALRKAYTEHIATMLALSGTEDAPAVATQVVAFERQLAEASTPREQLRDPNKRHNEVDTDGLAGLTPGLPWPAYFEAVGAATPGVLNVSPESFMSAMAEITVGPSAKAQRAERLQTVKAYLRWQLVNSAAPYLSAAFVEAEFRFFDKRLRGQSEPTPRWQRCVEVTDHALGETLAQGFVAQHFAGDSKEIALSMIHAIEEAFAAGLPGLSWMNDATRTRALEKMHAVVNKIGFPDRWRDYSAMQLGGQHLENIRAARRFEFDRGFAEIGQPVDKQEWHMTPPTVNAYYNPSNNEMVFPAGILQRPFFDADYPMAMNFGGIGMVMGHELTHGFDDQGRKYDGAGRLTEWWDASSVAKFEERAQCVSELYDTYEVQPGVNLNGKLTLGENIADFGGIKDAFRAWRAYAEANAEAASPAVDALNNDQLFFVAFGQIWCSKATPEAERVLALTDPHSHARYRVNGPLSNLPEFWETFSCEPGEPMRPVNTCEVW